MSDLDRREFAELLKASGNMLRTMMLIGIFTCSVASC
jgi:hypothetical protein